MTKRESDAIPDELPPDMRAELNRRWNAHLGVNHIGARLDIVSRGELRAIVDPVQPHHRGGMGTSAVNGPTMAGIFDLVTGLADLVNDSRWEAPERGIRYWKGSGRIFFRAAASDISPA